MAHRYTWDKLVQGATRLNPKSRGRNYPYTPRFETMTFTSGINRGQKVIVPFVGTRSCVVSLRAWGVTQASLHKVTLQFHEVDILTEDPHSRDYFQVKYNDVMYWVHKFDRFKNPLTSRCSCFTADTEILLADGTFVPIGQLVGREGFDIISYNEQLDKFEKVKAYNCSKKGENQQLLKITLDDGQEIKCTPEHKFLLRDGSWVEAKDLKESDSLRALYYRTTNKGKMKRLLPDGKEQTIVEHKGKEDFYTYVYLDPRYPGEYNYKSCSFNFKPIYVGKGRRNRYLSHWQQPNRNDRFHNTLKHLKSIGLEPIILKQSINLTEHVAYRIENQLTNEIGLECENKGPLLNRKHGGEGGLSGIAEITVKDRMIHNNPMKNKEISQKVLQANKENGCFERASKRMQQNNPMFNEEIQNKVRNTMYSKYTKEELSRIGKEIASHRTTETWEKIRHTSKTNPKAITAHKKAGQNLSKLNKERVNNGTHHTLTPEWKEICKQNAAKKIQKLHDNTLKQLVEIIKREGFINLDLYQYKKGYNYSIGALKSNNRQKYIQQEAMEQSVLNHKVIKIEKINTADVYCLTAEYNGNFIVKCNNDGYTVKSGVVVSNCADEYFTWAIWKYKAGCLYGPMPKPYVRKTTTYPPRNPARIIGCCKHIYNAWTILRNSGLTVN